MRRLHTLVMGLGLAGLLATSAVARQTPPSEGGQTASPPGRMGMHGMMAGCQDHAKLKADVTASLAKVREARTKADATVVTAALANAEQTLAAVQAHFTTCGAMMEKMKGGTPAPRADEHKH